MRRIIMLVLCLTSTALLTAPASTAAPTPSEVVLNIAHRGASGHAPEHTIAAYDLALSLGADYIEQDLQMTADGVLVVMHDSTLNRTARGAAENCAGPVNAKTLAQVKTCDMGSWFNERYPDRAKPEYVGQRIPTLQEVFERYARSTNYHIETKSPEQAPGMEEALLELIDRFGLHDPAVEEWQVLIQSFSPASLIKIHTLDDSLPLIQLDLGGVFAATPAGLELVASYAAGIGPSSGGVTQTVVEQAHARCLEVHPYTVDSPAELARLVGLGVDGIFTNFPDRLDVVLGDDAVQGRAAAALAATAHRNCTRA